jgi:hypothetical protein
LFSNYIISFLIAAAECSGLPTKRYEKLSRLRML